MRGTLQHRTDKVWEQLDSNHFPDAMYIGSTFDVDVYFTTSSYIIKHSKDDMMCYILPFNITLDDLYVGYTRTGEVLKAHGYPAESRILWNSLVAVYNEILTHNITN